jgi:hypothetical protein
MRRSRRVFAAVSLAPAGVLRLNVPHLTLELLYPPLPDLEGLKAALAEVAQQSHPCRVPALGVVREVSGAISVELALTPELVALRRELADALIRCGAKPHPGPLGGWRPHLSVVGQEELDSKDWAQPEPDPAVAAYRFPVDNLTLSLPTRSPTRFREVGPFWLGVPNESPTRM